MDKGNRKPDKSPTPGKKNKEEERGFGVIDQRNLITALNAMIKNNALYKYHGTLRKVCELISNLTEKSKKLENQVRRWQTPPSITDSVDNLSSTTSLSRTDPEVVQLDDGCALTTTGQETEISVNRLREANEKLSKQNEKMKAKIRDMEKLITEKGDLEARWTSEKLEMMQKSSRLSKIIDTLRSKLDKESKRREDLEKETKQKQNKPSSIETGSSSSSSSSCRVSKSTESFFVRNGSATKLQRPTTGVKNVRTTESVDENSEKFSRRIEELERDLSDRDSSIGELEKRLRECEESAEESRVCKKSLEDELSKLKSQLDDSLEKPYSNFTEKESVFEKLELVRDQQDPDDRKSHTENESQIRLTHSGAKDDSFHIVVQPEEQSSREVTEKKTLATEENTQLDGNYQQGPEYGTGTKNVITGENPKDIMSTMSTVICRSDEDGSASTKDSEITSRSLSSDWNTGHIGDVVTVGAPDNNPESAVQQLYWLMEKIEIQEEIIRRGRTRRNDDERVGSTAPKQEPAEEISGKVEELQNELTAKTKEIVRKDECLQNQFEVIDQLKNCLSASGKDKEMKAMAHRLEHQQKVITCLKEKGALYESYVRDYQEEVRKLTEELRMTSSSEAVMSNNSSKMNSQRQSKEKLDLVEAVKNRKSSGRM